MPTAILPPSSSPPGPSPSRGRLDPLLGTTLGPYVLERRIGEGGLGRVYLGVQPDIGLRVAIKVLGTQDAPPPDGFIERFQKEAQALARVSHPNVVRILGYSAGPPFPYLVMEMVEDARPLNWFLDRGVPAALAAHLLRQLLNALEAVHAAQVVHRDLKPSNILVQAVPGEPHLLRLVDFGLAKFLEGGQTTRLAGGTPAYMGPEQMGGLPIGPPTDVYAVGVLAAELFSGQRIFGRLPEAEILRVKRDPTFRIRGRLVEPGLPSALGDFVDAATAFRAEDRPADAPTLRAMLEASLARPAGASSPPLVPPPMEHDSLVELDPGPPEPTSAGSRPFLGAVAETTAPIDASGRGRVAWAWAAAAHSAVLLLTYLAIALDEVPATSSATSSTSLDEVPATSAVSRLPPPRLLGEDHLPAVAHLTPRPVVEAVPVDERPAPVPAVEPRPVPSVRPRAPARPRETPISTPTPQTSTSTVANPLPGRVRAALARCDCVGARAALAAWPQPPAGFKTAVSDCQPPMIGEPCVPGTLP
jgi:serine/threonine protein kinase